MSSASQRHYELGADSSRLGHRRIGKQRQRHVVVGFPFELRRLGQMPPICLACARWLRFFRKATTVDSVATFVTAFGRQNGDASAKRTITEDKFRNVDVAHVESEIRRRNRTALASFFRKTCSHCNPRLKSALTPDFLSRMLRRLLSSLIFALLCTTAVQAAQIPSELAQSLKIYRAEGAMNWAYVQTTESSKGQSLVEHYDPSKPQFSRWTLLKKNGAAPRESDLKDYRDRLSRRTNGTAPNIKDQIDPTTCELLSEDNERASYRFKLLTTDKGDRSAAHMHAVFTLHKPTGIIERVTLSSFEAFSPMFSVKVNEASTTIEYTLPTPERPTLLQKITVRMRGSVMWLKSLDEDMTVVYSDYTYVGKKTAAQ